MTAKLIYLKPMSKEEVLIFAPQINSYERYDFANECYDYLVYEMDEIVVKYRWICPYICEFALKSGSKAVAIFNTEKDA